MRYYLVDRISAWEADKRIRGIKNVAMTEDFLQYHFPHRPTMPGVLLLESMTQLAGWLEAISSEFTRWFLLEIPAQPDPKPPSATPCAAGPRSQTSNNRPGHRPDP